MLVHTRIVLHSSAPDHRYQQWPGASITPQTTELAMKARYVAPQWVKQA